jgi:hypothetical protein
MDIFDVEGWEAKGEFLQFLSNIGHADCQSAIRQATSLRYSQRRLTSAATEVNV